MKRSDFLHRLIVVAGFGSFNLQTLIPKRKIYLQQFFVAGFRHYMGMDLLPYMQVGDLLELRREPENLYDDCAIALHWQQEKIGYVPYELNEIPAKLLDAKALPLLGMITHLNSEVKPWENVAVAIFFLQDETIEVPAYLGLKAEPVYTSSKKTGKDKLFEQVFDNSNRIVNIENVQVPAIREHLEKHYGGKMHTIMLQGKPHAHINTNDIYTYMYNVNPVKWVTADDGNKYILFEFIENPATDHYALPAKKSP